MRILGLNTSVEKICDAVTKEHNEHIKLSKDVAAAAVLISSLVALIVGSSIFLPKLKILLLG
jgi:diacylglycerol kinase